LYFTLTGGEIKDVEIGRNLAIDEIHNVSEFLEKLEDEDIDNIDYLELRACDESCAGGILCAGNRFLIEDRQKKRAQGKPAKVTPEENRLLDYIPYLRENLKIGKVAPRSMDKLDDNIAVAMRKMKRSFEINEDLPQVDCRICGYQTCKAFSEAIVNGDADVRQCIFVQRILEQTDKLTTPEALKLMRKVWGEKKIEKHSIKHLDLE
jgi:hypothetical protein